MKTSSPHSPKPVQIVVVTGLDQPKRLMTGLSLAVASAAAGTEVRVFLSMDGVQCLDPRICGQVVLPGYPPISELFSVIRDAGGVIEYCPHCLPTGCDNWIARRAVSGESPCGCVGLPAGLASYGVHLGDYSTIIV